LQAKKLKLQLEAKERASVLAAQRKAEEKERWWAGVDFFAKNRSSKAGVDEGDDTGNNGVKTEQRYSMDYSRWDTWVPQDPATLQEVPSLVHDH
jgi:hypothetical protein